MPDPKDHQDEELASQPAAPASEVAKFETKIEHSNVAAAAQGPQASAQGTMHLGDVIVHGTAIFAGTSVPGASAAGTPSILKPTPSYPDAETEMLSKKLVVAQARKQRLLAHQADTTEVVQEILDLKRRLREGGQLKAGDMLGDGRYLLLDVLGRGGFATVWRARDAVRDEVVAIKVLHSHLAGDSIRLDRFKRGARIMGELEHEAVVRVLERYGEDAGWHYFVMEFLPNGDLFQAVLTGRFQNQQPVALMLPICEAVAEAHSRGFIHRDIKPGNIVLTASDELRITDFDLAGDSNSTGGTGTGALGTYAYSAPDNAKTADSRADVFSLGMTIIFMLHGDDLPSPRVVLHQKLIKGLPATAAVQGVLLRATHEDKEFRFQDAGALRDALSAALLDPEDAASASETPVETEGDPHSRASASITRFRAFEIAGWSAVGYLLSTLPAIWLDPKLEHHEIPHYRSINYAHGNTVIPIGLVLFASTLTLAYRIPRQKLWIFAGLPFVVAVVVSLPIFAPQFPHPHVVLMSATWFAMLVAWLAVSGPLRSTIRRGPISQLVLISASLAPIFTAIRLPGALRDFNDIDSDVAERDLFKVVAIIDMAVMWAFWWLGPTLEIHLTGKTISRELLPVVGSTTTASTRDSSER